MNVIIETDRLLLRTFTSDDAPLIYQLNLDPEVTRYTLDPMVSIDQAKEVLENIILPQYALYNHGRWATHTKSNMDFIGWCGLKMRPELNEIDLGYRFLKASWGNGYATEAAYACIKYGFEELHLQRIVGRALPGNLASIRVLEKIGMNYVGEENIEALLHKTYDIFNPLIR
jgi:RimJ/RimL family protein N-acetyltransferase